MNADVRERQPLTRVDAALERHRALLLAGAALTGLVVLCAWAWTKHTGAFPMAGGHPPAAVRDGYGYAVLLAARSLSSFASPIVALVTVGILAGVARRSVGPRGGVAALATAGVVVITTLAKHVPKGYETALPSGHAAYGAAVGGFAAWLLLRQGHRGRAGAVAGLGLLMAPGRVVEGLHTVAEAVTGAALGYAWLVAVLVISRPWRSAPPVTPIRSSREAST